MNTQGLFEHLTCTQTTTQVLWMVLAEAKCYTSKMQCTNVTNAFFPLSRALLLSVFLTLAPPCLISQWAMGVSSSNARQGESVCFAELLSEHGVSSWMMVGPEVTGEPEGPCYTSIHISWQQCLFIHPVLCYLKPAHQNPHNIYL